MVQKNRDSIMSYFSATDVPQQSFEQARRGYSLDDYETALRVFEPMAETGDVTTDWSMSL